MKHYLVIRGTRANQKDLRVGEVIELDDRTARILIDCGKIVPHQVAIEPEIVTSAVDDIVNRDPVIKRRGRKPKYGV